MGKHSGVGKKLTVTEIGLVGDYENFDLTIANLIEGGWDSTKTHDETPSVNSATGINVTQSWPNVNDVGSFQIHCNEDESFIDPEATALGDSFHKMSTTVYVDLFARDAELLKMGQREINRIVWENSPKSGTPVLKTDGTNSPIIQFENTELDWIRTPRPTTDDLDEFPHSSTKLICIWYKRKS